MPCDDSPVYIGISESVNSPIIIGESRRSSVNKIISVGSLSDITQGGAAPGSARNHYGTVAMDPRPLHSTTTLSASRSSSSSASSSSASSFDRQPRNESTNSASSLILILERAGQASSEDSGRVSLDRNSSKEIDSQRSNVNYNGNNENKETNGFSVKVASSSSLENLAKKKAARCRRRRSNASPRKIRQNSRPREVNENDTIDGFVATSTLTKNRDSGVLSVLTNSSRSAGKVKLHSSTWRDREDRDVTISPEIALTSYEQTTVKSQQSTISVASIRDTNTMNIGDSSIMNNYPSIQGISSSTISILDNVSGNFAVRCNVPSASAPTLLNHHHHHLHRKKQIPCLPGVSMSHSTSLQSSLLPINVAGSSQVSPKRMNKNKDINTTITAWKSARASPVKPESSFVDSTVFADVPAKATQVEPAAVIETIDSSASTMKVTKANRARKSLHASLGQLPTTTSSCAQSTIGGEATSFENLETEATSTGHESNADPASMPINLYSTNSTYAITRASLERVCLYNGTATVPDASSKIPIIGSASTGNSSNVVNSLKNSLVASPGNNNNSKNNGRCNHLSGNCTGSCATTTSQTSSNSPRTPCLFAGVASTSSWANNSVEQENDYVVDPVQGNAYHKGQFLGKGGFARVYLMTDVANGNQYACKIIPKNRMQKIHIQKIAREIMIHKELNHVNVVQMHHYFEDNINVYMLLEPCPRKSLMHVLKYRGKVTEPEARYYMKQMVTGVAYIHSQKVVHRDLKPGNMFLSDGMIVKIGDFGLATRPDGQRRRVTICGTPNYIAPEVLYKQAYSYEADVWALGCILYALLAGQPPFDTATLKETYARICNNRYKKLDDSVVSRSGQDLIRWLLQPIPELRPSLERVKEHAYLTMEYVPTKLAHTCCYRMPPPQSLLPEQTQFAVPQQLGLSCNSIISRGLVNAENIDKNKRDIAAGTIIQKSTNHTTNGTLSHSQLEAMKNNSKKPKVGNWLFRKLPKLPRFRQRLSKLLCPEQKKPDNSVMMHRALEACLAEIRCTRTQENPMLVDRIAPLFVTKWIDYSNKYGLGFQLSDRSVGVLFNDSTKMSYTHDRRRVEYATTEDEVTRYRRELDVPSCMEEKLELLRHFTHYMDNFLTNGGEVREARSTKLSRTNSSSVPRMRRWLRTDKAIVMELTVPLLQVNFFVDHSKIVVSEGPRGRGYLVTYIDASRQASSYWLNDLRDVGCTADLYERLHYVCKVIAELENEAIFDQPAVTHRKTFKT